MTERIIECPLPKNKKCVIGIIIFGARAQSEDCRAPSVFGYV
jgi:hypothetical protein